MVSKLNSDRKAGEGAGQAMTRIYGKIGFTGLWNGLPVRIFMIGTLTVRSPPLTMTTMSRENESTMLTTPTGFPMAHLRLIQSVPWGKCPTSCARVMEGVQFKDRF